MHILAFYDLFFDRLELKLQQNLNHQQPCCLRLRKCHALWKRRFCEETLSSGYGGK